MPSDIVKKIGSGMAYQSVAQSMAIAVQDATDHLRDVETIVSTALGVAAAKYVATGENKWFIVMQNLLKLVGTSAGNFKTIGDDSAEILKEFSKIG